MHPNLIRTLVVTLGLAAVGASSAHADEILVTAQGLRQGRIVGNAAGGKIVATKFSYEVVSPRDVATGQASGKRQHKPITITKDWGPASKQLFEAMLTNEVLSSVTLEFVGTAATGVRETTHLIKLTNANVTGLKRYTSGTVQVEDVSLTFQTIEWQDAPNEPLVRDDW